jgi:hypothetical protein
VGSPSCVCNASMRIKDFGEIWLLLCNELLELNDLANFLKGKDLVLLVSIYGEACRVVSAVFEAGESW